MTESEHFRKFFGPMNTRSELPKALWIFYPEFSLWIFDIKTGTRACYLYSKKWVWGGVTQLEMRKMHVVIRKGGLSSLVSYCCTLLCDALMVSDRDPNTVNSLSCCTAKIVMMRSVVQLRKHTNSESKRPHGAWLVVLNLLIFDLRVMGQN